VREFSGSVEVIHLSLRDISVANQLGRDSAPDSENYASGEWINAYSYLGAKRLSLGVEGSNVACGLSATIFQPPFMNFIAVTI